MQARDKYEFFVSVEERIQGYSSFILLKIHLKNKIENFDNAVKTLLQL